MAKLRRLLDEAGFGSTTLIQGEAGQPSWAPKGHWLYKDGFDDPRAQVVWLLRRFALDVYAGAAFSSFFMIADIWEKPYETATQTLPRAQANGILNGLVYTPKPSYDAFCHAAAIWNGDVAPAAASMRIETEAVIAEVPVCLSFSKNETPLHLYYLPSAPSESRLYKNGAAVRLEKEFFDGVLVDTLSGEVFSLPRPEACRDAFVYPDLPIASYPFILAEKSAIEIESL